ncbi:MAG: acetylglutamate kinase [Flavisolibacter sp.]
MDKIYIVKIGGNIIDDEQQLSSFLKQFAGIGEKKILVHGGGKLATRLAAQLNIPQVMVEGRRITDTETLKLVIMVYAGYINKNIVAQLQASGCNAFGFSGADGNVILAHKRQHPEMDYGFAGDVDQVNHELLLDLLNKNYCPVLSPITHDGKGQLLNTNADTIAQETAQTMGKTAKVILIYTFEKEGVLQDVNDPSSVIASLDEKTYKDNKSAGVIFEGMVPKLDNAFRALKAGVHKVMIGKAENLEQLFTGEKGTSIIGS